MAFEVDKGRIILHDGYDGHVEFVHVSHIEGISIKDRTIRLNLREHTVTELYFETPFGAWRAYEDLLRIVDKKKLREHARYHLP